MATHPAYTAASADPADLAHDARNALTSALGRLQLLRRQAERGQLDLTALAASLAHTAEQLRRAATLVDALEDAAAASGPTRLPRRSAA